MNCIIMIFKTIFIYILVAVVFRVMGKREVGQLGTFDLIVYILMAELVAISIEEDGSFFINIIPVIFLMFMQILISKISLKNEKIRNLIEGKPTVMIKKGIINFKNMVEQRYSLDDLLLQLREKDIRSIDEVDYAILENNGKLSVFKKDDSNNKTYPLPIIMDGKVNLDNLLLIKKSKKWLLNTLYDKNITVDKIFYAFVRDNDLYIIRYNELEK